MKQLLLPFLPNLRQILILFAFCMGLLVSCKQNKPENISSLKEVDYDKLLSDVFDFIGMNKMPDSSIVYIDKLDQIANNKGYYGDLSVSLKAKSLYYKQRNNTNQAYRNAYRRIAVVSLTKDSIDMFDALYDAAKLHFERGTFMSAVSYFIQLSNENISNPYNQTAIFYNFGRIYEKIWRDSLFDYYDAMIRTENKYKRKESLIPYLLHGRAENYMRIGGFSDKKLFSFEANTSHQQDSLREAVRLYLKANKYFDIHVVNNSKLAITYALLGDIQQAKLAIKNAEIEALLHNLPIAPVFCSKAVLAYREKDFRKAIALADSGQHLSQHVDFQNYRVKCLKIISKSYEALGDYKNALFYLEKEKDLSEEIRREEKNKQMVVYQIQLDTQQKELRLKKAKILTDSYRLWITIVVVVAAIIIVLLFITLSLYRKNKRAYYALIQKHKAWAKEKGENKTPKAEIYSMVIKESGEEKNEGRKEDEDEKLIEQLFELLDEKKIFMNEGLTVPILAELLNTNRYYLSDAINRICGKNFCTLINEYRIKEAINMLTDPKNDCFSIDSIGYDVGFKNRATFYKVFKRITNLSPSDFRKHRNDGLVNFVEDDCISPCKNGK